MELINKLGGRKFLMAILVIGVAVFLDVKTAKGLSLEMTGFLVAVLGAFSAANYATTVKHMNSRGQGGAAPKADLGPIENQLNNVQAMLKAGAANPETLQVLLNTLSSMKSDIESVKGTTGQIGIAMVELVKR